MKDNPLVPRRKPKQQDVATYRVNDSQIQAIEVASFMVDLPQVMEEDNE
tara:strand:+ start:1802 stop:1948 length:147 start_codon:yes stop_codon:yes gene_type:complete